MTFGLKPGAVDKGCLENFKVRPIRHRDLSMYDNCFFENWYQQSQDWDFSLIVQFFDFVKGFKGRSSRRKVQDPVLSFCQNSKRISWEISSFDSSVCSLKELWEGNGNSHSHNSGTVYRDGKGTRNLHMKKICRQFFFENR